MKTCRRCGETRPLAEFYAHKLTSDGRTTYCKTCSKAATRDWQVRNSKRVATTNRASHLMRKYGLTPEDFAAMVATQNNTCAICHRPQADGSPLCVDHCHTTGKVRALLCSPCNTALGLAEDNADRCRAMGAYLDLHHSSQRRNTN